MTLANNTFPFYTQTIIAQASNSWKLTTSMWHSLPQPHLLLFWEILRKHFKCTVCSVTSLGFSFFNYSSCHDLCSTSRFETITELGQLPPAGDLPLIYTPPTLSGPYSRSPPPEHGSGLQQPLEIASCEPKQNHRNPSQAGISSGSR